MLCIQQCVCTQSLSPIRVFATPGTVAHQAPQSMGFSRQEYWSGLPFPPPRDLPNPGIKPTSLKLPALSGRFFTTSITWETQKQALLAFRAKCSGSSSSQSRTPRLGSAMWGLDPSFIGGHLCNFNYLLLVDSPAWWYGSWLYYIYAPPTHIIVPPLNLEL